jgi:hypothetical protein
VDVAGDRRIVAWCAAGVGSELRPIVRREYQVLFDLYSPSSADAFQRRDEPSWAAAHPADEEVSGNAISPAPLLEDLEINRVGQLPHDIIGCLTESGVAQHISHFLPAECHGEHLLTEEPLCPAVESVSAVLSMPLERPRAA